MWLKGSQLSSTASASRRHASRMACALLSRLPWDSITPLGLPVVPDVYMMVASVPGPVTFSLRVSSADVRERAALPRWRKERQDHRTIFSEENPGTARFAV